MNKSEIGDRLPNRPGVNETTATVIFSDLLPYSGWISTSFRCPRQRMRSDGTSLRPARQALANAFSRRTYAAPITPATRMIKGGYTLDIGFSRCSCPSNPAELGRRTPDRARPARTTAANEQCCASENRTTMLSSEFGPSQISIDFFSASRLAGRAEARYPGLSRA